MYTKETSPIYTQEDLDRLIEQRRELDDKIDEVEAYIRQESVGKLEDEYRKLLVGKILVSTNDWGHGSFMLPSPRISVALRNSRCMPKSSLSTLTMKLLGKPRSGSLGKSMTSLS